MDIELRYAGSGNWDVYVNGRYRYCGWCYNDAAEYADGIRDGMGK